MNTDIRLSTGFFAHPKIKKLTRKLGPDAVLALLRLWLWTVQNRPDGVLSGMDKDDIEITADWCGEEGALASALVDLRLIDAVGDVFEVHNWEERNPWQAEAENRADKGRFAKLRQSYPEEYERLKAMGINAISKAEYARITGARHASDAPTAGSQGEANRVPTGTPQGTPGSPTGPGPLQCLSSSSPDPDPNQKKKTPCQVFGKDSEPYQLAVLMRDTLKANVPTLKEPDLQKWAQAFDVALRNDERMKDAGFVEQVIRWACSDDFWRANIQSPGKLREKFDQLTAKMQSASSGRMGPVGRTGFGRYDGGKQDYGQSDFGALGGATVGNDAT